MGGEQAAPAAAFGSEAALGGDAAVAAAGTAAEFVPEGQAVPPTEDNPAPTINFDEVQSEIASATPMDTSLAPIDGMDEEVEIAVEENTQDDVVG
jgi:hypothetical protein